jgi:hypothetical protein
MRGEEKTFFTAAPLTRFCGRMDDFCSQTSAVGWGGGKKGSESVDSMGKIVK